MNILHILFRLSVVGLLICSGAASAREVQILNFGLSGRAAVADDGGKPDFGTDDTVPVPETPVPSAAALAMPKVVVPLWMRRAPQSPVPVIPVNLLQNCDETFYRPNARLGLEAERRRSQYYPLVMAIACEAGVPGHLFDALISQESRYNPAAISPKGAAGLTQLMPETAVNLGVANRFDVLQNLRGGARYLRSQLDEFGRYDLALGAYNAGPARVRQYKSLPPFRETLLYVKTILSDVRAAVVGSTDYGDVDRRAKFRTASCMGFRQ